MKSVGIIVTIWLLSACTSTKVHLYTRYLSETDIKQVSKNLEALGFDVISNKLMFPEGIEQSTVLYSPFVEGEDTINRLISSMAEQGWPIPWVQPIVAGNHYYTKNSLGLLLLPQGAKRHDQVHPQDMVNEYQSKDCHISLKLTLHNDASYQFAYQNQQASQQAKQQAGQQEQMQGRWQITSYPYLELVSSTKYRRFYYEIQSTTKKDLVGQINFIELKPIDDHYSLPQCSFHYGLRQ
jgi:hypothetical protein